MEHCHEGRVPVAVRSYGLPDENGYRCIHLPRQVGVRTKPKYWARESVGIQALEIGPRELELPALIGQVSNVAGEKYEVSQLCPDVGSACCEETELCSMMNSRKDELFVLQAIDRSQRPLIDEGAEQGLVRIVCGHSGR